MKTALPSVLRISDFQTVRLERDLDGGKLETIGTLATGLTVRAVFDPATGPKEAWETLDWEQARKRL